MVLEIPFLFLLAEILGIEISEYLFYLIIAVVALVVLVLAVWAKWIRVPRPTTRERQQLYEELTKLSEQKAKQNSKLALVEDARKHGRLPRPEYDEQKEKIQAEIDKLNMKIDGKIDELATTYYGYSIKQERSKARGLVDQVMILQARNKELETKMTDVSRKFEDAEDKIKGLEEEKQDYRKVISSGGEEEVSPLAVEKVHDLESRIHELEEKADGYRDKMEEYYNKTLLLDLLVSRYGDYIEDKEEKTVYDLKEAVQPDNSHVEEIAEGIARKFPHYDPKANILKACEMGYEYVTDEIASVPSLGVDFWMSIGEMIEKKVADYEDKAILLCSIFRALGAESLVLIVELTDGSNRPLVSLKAGTRCVLVDPNKKHDFKRYVGDIDDIIQGYEKKGTKIARILYEFNDKEYKEYEI